LRPRDLRRKWQCGAAHCQMQKQAAWKLHDVPSIILDYEIIEDQSALMLAARTTLPHFSVSSAMNFSNAAVEVGNTMLPRSANRAFMTGLASAALISLLSVPMISAGVFFGAPTPHQVIASNPGTKSAKVGRSGSVSERPALVTARARIVPALM